MGVILLSSFRSYASDGVTPEVLSAFLSRFHAATQGNWDERHGYFVAEFVLDGVKKSAYFDQQGNLVVVGKQIAPAQLPEYLAAALDESYGDYTLSALFELEDEHGTSYFAVAVNEGKEKILRATSKKWRCVRTRNRKGL